MLRHHTWQFAAALIALLCGVSCSTPVQSADDQGTLRFFFEILPLDGDGHDWESAASRRIVSRDPDTSTSTFRFGAPDYEYTWPANYRLTDADGNVVLDLTDTTWIKASIVHITEDGVEVVRSVYWLVTDEDVENLPRSLSGLTAATGPDGDVVVGAEESISFDGSSTAYLTSGGNFDVRFSVGRFQK